VNIYTHTHTTHTQTFQNMGHGSIYTREIMKIVE